MTGNEDERIRTLRGKEERRRIENLGQERLASVWKTGVEDWRLTEMTKVGCHLLAARESVNRTQDPENPGIWALWEDGERRN